MNPVEINVWNYRNIKIRTHQVHGHKQTDMTHKSLADSGCRSLLHHCSLCSSIFFQCLVCSKIQTIWALCMGIIETYSLRKPRWQLSWKPVPRPKDSVKWRNWHMLLHRRAWTVVMYYSPGSRSFLHKMKSWPPSWKCDIKLKIGLHQSMHTVST